MAIGSRFRWLDESFRAWRASVTLLALLIAIPDIARADVDLTNDWVVTYRTDPPVSLEITCDLVFTQSGTDLGASGTCRGFCANGTCEGLQSSSATFSGTVDPGTGMFSLTGQLDLVTSSFPPNPTLVAVSFDGAPVDAAHLEGSATVDGHPGTFDAVLCGNGNLDAGETCDDGAATDGCCTASCTPKPDGVSCQSTAGCQTMPTCAAGACVGTPKPAGTQCEAEGNPCTDDACDGAGACVAGPCSPCCGGDACTSEIRFDCVQPADMRDVIDIRAPLRAKPKDRILWRVPQLGATSADDLPDPETTDYAVCFYALDFREALTLVFDSVAPAGQGCGQSRCWTRTRKGGVAYNGGQLKPDGVASLRVAPGPEDRASLAFAARGPNVDLTPAIPGQELFPGGELLVQLRAGDACWSAFYVNSGSPPDIRTNTRYRTKGHFE